MAAKKHVRKANPKRRAGGRKNPITALNTKTGKRMQFFKDSEIAGIQKKAKELADALVLSVPSKYSAAEKGLIASVAGTYYLPGKSVTKKSIDSLVKKLDADAPFVDGSSKSVLTKVKNRLKTILAQQTGIASTKAKNAPTIKTLGQIARDVKSKRSGAAMKKYSLKDIDASAADIDASGLTLADLEQIAKNMKSGNPGKGGKKMAASKKKKKIGKKKSVKRKVSKKKPAGKKKTAGRKKSKTKRSGKRKIRVGYSKATNTALLKSEKAARKQLSKRGKKKGSLSTKRKVRVQWQRMNPGAGLPEKASTMEVLKRIAMVAAIGAGAGALNRVAAGALSAGLDKVGLGKIKDFKLGAVPVGGILVSSIIPALGIVAAKKMSKQKGDIGDMIADVLMITTAANIGQRVVGAILPSSMAGVEPMLMGVEPMLMGDADFGYGDADFGDADFGAIEQFSGVEPQLMGDADFGYGSADFGAIEQFSGHDAASLGAIQLHGDEDYAGDDLDGDDMDGDSEFGLG